MNKFNITGMSCAACSARIEKAVLKVNGVTKCSVNLLTNSMNVQGTANVQNIINVVQKAGYGAQLVLENKNNSSNLKNQIKNNDNNETKKLLLRLISSSFFLLILIYFAMGHKLFNLPLPVFFNNNHIAVGLIQLILTFIIIIINQKYFVSGVKAIIHLSPNMDSLVSLGSFFAFIYSIVVLFLMTNCVVDGDFEKSKMLMNQLYFETSAMVLVLITIGKTLESFSKGKTTNAIKSLKNLAPKVVLIRKDNKEFEVELEDVKVGDIFIVKPGMNVPVDGTVIEGGGSVNESSLTGESIPVEKKISDSVTSGTVNQEGVLVCVATRVGSETTLSKIIQLVSDAVSSKAPIAKIADIVAGFFVPVVLGISIITFICWFAFGKSISFSLARAISVLVISCPCALGLATPVAIMVGSGIGAKNGILFKTSEVLEKAGKLKIIALDKTGTITKGEPVVKNIIPFNSISQNELLKIAYSLEKNSEHPLSKAIIKKAKEINLDFYNVTDFKNILGNGLEGILNEKKVWAGKIQFIKEKINYKIDKSILDNANEYFEQGQTLLFFADQEKFLGFICVSDDVKEDSKSAINELKKLGLKVVMLTGDNEKTAKKIASEVGIENVVAGILPDQKQFEIKKLKQEGLTAMVGDGINDALALTSSDVGIALGAGSDVSIDSADIVLMKNNLLDIPSLIKISRATIKNIYQNLFWAFAYNIIGIPLASGVFIGLTGWTLNPMLGAALMSFSSVFVVCNALRLNFIKVYNKNQKDLVQFDTKKQGENKMTIKVKGMMCTHCESHVKSALEKIDGVVSATANYQTETVEIITNKEINKELFEKAIIDAGYEYIK